MIVDDLKPNGKLFLSLLTVEILSFTAFIFPFWEKRFYLVFVLLVFFVSLWNLRFGVLTIFAELVIGSKGYLFFFNWGEQRFSIRLGIFLAVFLAAFFWVWRERICYLFKWSFVKYYFLIFLAIFFGIILGLLRNNDLKSIFLDSNGLLFFAMIFPFIQAFHGEDKGGSLTPFLRVLSTALLIVFIKTLLIFILFAHPFVWPYLLPSIYSWIRDTGVGEITQLESGFVRIFFQSHFYFVVLYFITAGLLLFPEKIKANCRKTIMLFVFFYFTIFTLLISSSRSFWLAIIIISPSVLCYFLIKKRITWRRTLGAVAFCLGVIVLSYVSAAFFSNLPLPNAPAKNLGNLFAERGKVLSEPAAASRWQLLRPLAQSIGRHPVLGSGFGATVTYFSQDPRLIAENPSGQYTTYAFEWGYLDFLYKLGILGSIIFGLLLLRIFMRSWQALQKKEKYLFTIAASFFALLIIHFFTPYLNHPLGIGWLMVVSMYMSRKESANSI